MSIAIVTSSLKQIVENVNKIKDSITIKEVTFPLIVSCGKLLNETVTMFKEDNPVIVTNYYSPVYEYIINIFENRIKKVTAVYFDLIWSAQIVDSPTPTPMPTGPFTGLMKWVVGLGVEPTSWVNLTDELVINSMLTEYRRSGGHLLYDVMKYMPFTIRLEAKVDDAINYNLVSSIHSNSLIKIQCILED